MKSQFQQDILRRGLTQLFLIVHRNLDGEKGRHGADMDEGEGLTRERIEEREDWGGRIRLMPCRASRREFSCFGA